MAITLFKPEIWNAQLLVSLKKSLVYGAPDVANRNYEGDIQRSGDSVRITSISRPTVADYVPNTTTITPEVLTDAQRVLTIDQSKYFSFEVDDVDARQAAGSVLEAGMNEAAYALADTADQYIASLYTGVQSSNNIGTVSVTTTDLAYTQIRLLKLKLDQSNVPQAGRWLIVPPWYYSLLLENQKFVDAAASGTTEPLNNGYIGQALGFSIRVSNNAPNPTGDDYVVLAGYSGAITYAEQINKTEAYRPQSSFSDAVKGLHLYGAKLIRPDGIAVLTASIT